MKSVRMSRNWRRVTAAALACVATVGLAACGSSADEPSSSGAATTITHALGETTIPDVPQRVVALGNQWLDAAQALGVTPVGYLDNIAALTKSRPAWEPASLAESKELTSEGLIEQVAALEPDLILADGFVYLSDRKIYDNLSQLAPTLPALGKEVVTPWRDQVTALGKVLHKQDKATEIIAGVDNRIQALAQQYPGLKGKTFASTWLYSAAQLMVLNDPKDGSAEIFTQLGMSIPQNLVSLPNTGGRVALSPERTTELQADLLLAAASPGLDQMYRELPGYRELPAVRKESVVSMSTQDISAVNQPSALNVPYILDKIQPALANAAK
ncbi:ABC transporter substrate-binding protein [Nocardia sp. NPDC051787]|uniref:ABC transporter substrate-binding protein n=1 Tax=Nocardia sp. NPDC051787 TaxID=3155415 RepID=UPI0034249291